MFHSKISKNPIPQVLYALTEFVLEQLFKLMANISKFGASSETPDP